MLKTAPQQSLLHVTTRSLRFNIKQNTNTCWNGISIRWKRNICKENMERLQSPSLIPSHKSHQVLRHHSVSPSISRLDTTTTTESSSVINWHWNCLCCSHPVKVSETGTHPSTLLTLTQDVNILVQGLFSQSVFQSIHVAHCLHWQWTTLSPAWQGQWIRDELLDQGG